MSKGELKTEGLISKAGSRVVTLLKSRIKSTAAYTRYASNIARESPRPQVQGIRRMGNPEPTVRVVGDRHEGPLLDSSVATR